MATVAGLTLQRLDQGVDLQGKPGQVLSLRVGGRVDAIKPDPGGFGQAVYVTTTSGQQVYFGHAQPLVSAGDVLKPGQGIVQLLEHPGGNATQPGWTEVGFAAGSAPAGPSTASRALAWLRSTLSVATSTGSGGGTTSSSSIQNPDDFWYAVETALGAKHDRATHDFLVSWSIAEGTKATNNPLATTLKLPGSTGLSGNPDGVQQYATPEQGVAATAQTIKGYPSILAALRRGVSFQSLSSPSITRELNIWSGHRSAGATVTAYVRNILLNFQGNPNANSAADWFSYDAGNLAHDAKTALEKVAPWASGLTSLIGNLLNPNTWRRVALVIAGAVLVMAGLFLVARNAGAAAVG